MHSSLFNLINQEKHRQETCINLIASENYASKAVLEAAGSVLTDKYAEGYPGRRYYSGCQIVDQIETYTCELAKRLFNTEHANVQPHSGSSANWSIFFSMLKPGDTVLGMNINAGGHLTHGHPLNFSGQLFNIIPYGVSPENECLDYDEIALLADQHQPKMIIAGASSYSRAIDYARIEQIARLHKALFFVDMAHIAGLVATGLHPSPAPYADIISSTTHKTLRGPRGGLILSKGEYAPKLDRAVMPGTQGGPLLNMIAAKAIAFEEAGTKEFAHYQAQIIKNAQAMAKTFQALGYRIVSGGTDNHLFCIDLQSKNSPGSLEKITGNVVEQALEKCNITVNRNLIPFDPEKPLITSGIRIGTPAITSRGFKEKDAELVAHWIDEIIRNRNNDQILKDIKTNVIALCKSFPISRR